ncbi:MAG TPA: alpha/beta hydrolase [Steroidobacteraceae bacterium]
MHARIFYAHTWKRAWPFCCGSGACLTNDRLLRSSLSGIFRRSFPLHSPRYARQTIAEICSLRAALATAIIGQTGSIASAALVVAGLTYEKAQESRDRGRYPAPGRFVDIGGRRLHLFVEGNAPGPTVVIEQGIGSPSVVWWPIQASIAKFARVCTYDRAGFLWSDPVEKDRSLDDMIADLHAVLKNGEVPSPYILVGHSMGGLLVRRFARAYPDLVAGIVLVDSPDELVVFRDAIRPFYTQGLRMQRILGVLARLGLLRLLGRRIPMLMLPDDPVGYALCATPQHARAAADDMQAMLNASQAMQQPDAPGALGNRPLLLLEHGIAFPPIAAAMEEGWSASQRRLTHLSTNSELLTADKCGHLIHVEAPGLVVESVRRVYAAACNRTQLKSAAA